MNLVMRGLAPKILARAQEIGGYGDRDWGSTSAEDRGPVDWKIRRSGGPRIGRPKDQRIGGSEEPIMLTYLTFLPYLT